MPGILIDDALIVTMDAQCRVLDRGWVHVEDGAIAGIGEGRAPKLDAERVGVGGDIVMPGMVNAHCHLSMSLFRGLGDDVPDRLERFIFPLERQFVGPEMVHIGARLAALELLEGGVTTVADMYYHETEVADALDEAGLRGVLGQTVIGFAVPDARDWQEAFARFDALVERCAGSPRLVASLAPHAPHTTGLALLERVADKAGRHPVQIHLAEVPREIAWAREAHGCGPVEVLRRAGLLDRRLIGAHGILLEQGEIEALAAADAAIVHNPGANAKAGKGWAPVLAMRAAGVRVGLGSDGPMSGNTIDILCQLSQATKGQKQATGDRSVMPAIAALEMATIGGARALGLDHVTGSLEVGKRADLVRISRHAARLSPMHDPVAALVYAAQAGDVEDVMIDGIWRLRGKTPVDLDRDSVVADAQQMAGAMRRGLT